MMMSDIEVLSEFAQVLKRYEQTLEAVERSTKPAASQVLEVLLARDAVRAALSDEIRENASSIARLAELDEKLQAQAKTIGTCPKLKQWQESLTPPETDWWWYIEAPPVKSPWDRWDWMLDALTAGALLLTGSFMVSTLQAFSSSGLSWQETFGTIIQGAGLAVLSRGALTQDGSQKVKQILKSMGLPSHLHSEATFVVSLALLAGAYSLNTSLPKFGERSFEEGLELYDRGLLTEAQERYLQALQFKSDDAQYNVALGEIYESLADLDLAMEQYHKAVEKGEPKGFNHAGRVYIQKGDPTRAEAFLRMGLQRVDGDKETEYQLYRNLGWALLNQEKYQEAEQSLKVAIRIDRNEIEGKQIGGGMGHCFLAQSLTMQQRSQEAQQQWDLCEEYARPETLNEYQWFMTVGQRELADRIDTGAVVFDARRNTLDQ